MKLRIHHISSWEKFIPLISAEGERVCICFSEHVIANFMETCLFLDITKIILKDTVQQMIKNII